MTNNSIRNLQIDGLRSIAMLAVIIHHFFYSFFNRFDYPLPLNSLLLEKAGYFGVGLFLIISGFYCKKEKGCFRGYVVRKLVRLWPEYFAAITICYIVTHIIVLPGRTVAFWEYLINIPFLNGFVGIAYVDPSHWYLTTLLSCLLISQLILRIENQQLLSLSLFAWIMLIVVLDHINTPYYYIGLLCRGGLTILGGTYAPMFITGLALGRVIPLLKERKNLGVETNDARQGSPYTKKNVVIKLEFIALIIIALLANIFIMKIERGITFIICVIVFCLTVYNCLPFLETRILLFLSRISYSTYLIHQNVGYCFILGFVNLVGYYSPIISFLCVLASPFMGYILYIITKYLKSIIGGNLLRRPGFRQ